MLKKMKFTAVALGLLASSAFANADSNVEPLTQITLSDKEVSAVNSVLQKTGGTDITISKAVSGPNNLIGLLLEMPLGENGESKQVFTWITSPTESASLIFGEVIKGKTNYTKLAIESLVDNPVGSETVSQHPTLDRLKSSSYVKVLPGDNEIKKEVFVVFDPLCPHCSDLYKLLDENKQTIIDKGIAINWVPVAIVSKKSLDYASHILKGGAKALHDIESKNEKPNDITIDKTLFNHINQNSQLVGKKGITMSVPFTVWFDGEQERAILGDMKNGELSQLVGDLPS
jgi:protein-disulfide isomerase